MELLAQGFSAAQAKPLAVATLMRSPVKEQGPAATAMRSTWGGPQAFQQVPGHGQQGLAVGQAGGGRPGQGGFVSHRATEAAVAEDSGLKFSLRTFFF